jgi:hypothetical protein
VVEGASLESLYVGNCIVGSNPILSAIKTEAIASVFFYMKKMESSLSNFFHIKENSLCKRLGFD